MLLPSPVGAAVELAVAALDALSAVGAPAGRGTARLWQVQGAKLQPLARAGGAAGARRVAAAAKLVAAAAPRARHTVKTAVKRKVRDNLRRGALKVGASSVCSLAEVALQRRSRSSLPAATASGTFAALGSAEEQLHGSHVAPYTSAPSCTPRAGSAGARSPCWTASAARLARSRRPPACGGTPTWAATRGAASGTAAGPRAATWSSRSAAPWPATWETCGRTRAWRSAPAWRPSRRAPGPPGRRSRRRRRATSAAGSRCAGTPWAARWPPSWPAPGRGAARASTARTPSAPAARWTDLTRSLACALAPADIAVHRVAGDPISAAFLPHAQRVYAKRRGCEGVDPHRLLHFLS
ncbi:unnamed protein product [Prorocentrum cordatum]|uniref:Uncharacterized protein n=1 Tax=Prorocentrum cordatum TaxID=2364126 RepID=A0ABN9UN79_9DINO|nr:unnamed protein product [Polarella glacialis]